MKSINQIARCFTLFRGKQLAQEGLGGHQQVYILNACHHPGLTQDQMAAKLYIDKSNVARQLAHLERAGYIVREEDPQDRRCRRIYPTPQAQELCPRIVAMRAQWVDYLAEGLTPEEKAQLETLLDRLSRRAIALAENPELLEEVRR